VITATIVVFFLVSLGLILGGFPSLQLDQTLVSTLAGNRLLAGSIANLIVADAAARSGVRFDWRAHARVGVPAAFATLGLVAAVCGLR